MSFETINIKNTKGEQAIRTPKEMKINDDKVYLKKLGNALYITPFNNPWQNLIEGIESFSQDFMDSREQPNDQNREAF